MSESRRVLLTGAFGSVGSSTLRALVEAGYGVTALDVRSQASATRAAELARDLAFETAWVDITDRAAVDGLLRGSAFEAILHVAAIIPPLAYQRPDLARAVNVDGTRHLIEAAEAMDARPRFVYTSSYSVHGPRNPHRDLPPLTAESPLDPADNYACHKVKCERLLRSSELPWTVLRLAAVATRGTAAMSEEAMRFTYLIPPEQPAAGVDVLDVATALARAIDADCVGRTFDIAGDASWQMTMGELMDMFFVAFGIPTLPTEAFRQADPEVDASWYFGGHVDTTEAQRVLAYQGHTRGQYEAAIRVSGPRRWAAMLAGPLVRRRLLGQSRFHGRPRTPDPTPMKQVILETFGMDPVEADCEPQT
jgi:nucleoside-diphosphate-sugar epimerase